MPEACLRHEAAPRRGDLAANCYALGCFLGLAGIKHCQPSLRPPHRGTAMRGSLQRQQLAKNDRITPKRPYCASAASTTGCHVSSLAARHSAATSATDRPSCSTATMSASCVSVSIWKSSSMYHAAGHLILVPLITVLTASSEGMPQSPGRSGLGPQLGVS